MSDVKQPEQLVAMGGTFYTMGGESWCDTPTDSWRLVAGVGYVRHDDAAKDIAAEVTAEVTREWLECFREAKAKGENLADSIFWRLALHALPEGVDPDHPEVMAALAEIRASVEARG